MPQYLPRHPPTTGVYLIILNLSWLTKALFYLCKYYIAEVKPIEVNSPTSTQKLKSKNLI